MFLWLFLLNLFSMHCSTASASFILGALSLYLLLLNFNLNTVRIRFIIPKKFNQGFFHGWKSAQHLPVFIRNAYSDKTKFIFFTLTAILPLTVKARTFSSTDKMMSKILTTETLSFVNKTKGFIPFLLLQPLIHSSSSLISSPLFDSASHRVSSAELISTCPLSYVKIINENIIFNLPLDEAQVFWKVALLSTGLRAPHFSIARLAEFWWQPQAWWPQWWLDFLDAHFTSKLSCRPRRHWLQYYKGSIFTLNYGMLWYSPGMNCYAQY